MSPRWENGAKSVIRLDLEARRDVVFDEFKPLALLVGEAVALLLLLRELVLKARVSLVREGHEFLVLPQLLIRVKECEMQDSCMTTSSVDTEPQ